MPSPTDFNLSPYYDDFVESKKFHRVLFRPAFAVQARELTQSQTILQNQIERFGDHMFEKGAMIIPGEISFDLNYYAVKLTSLGSGNTLAQFTTGTVLTGGSSGVQALIVNRVATDGTDPDTLYVKYLDSGTSKTSTSFTDGETLTGTNSDSVSLSCVVDTTATGSAASIEAGVYYINGFFVSVDQQTLILDKYTNTPSYRVGVTITETFVTPNDDASLNDNAAGSSNVNAPGAHRFKIDLTLAKRTLTSTEDADFVELLRLENGVRTNQVRSTEYAVLEDTFARRTFDESGDYTVREFDLDVREHLISGNNRGIYTSGNGGDVTKLALGLSPGKAYVKGYEIETIGTTFIEINKARSFDTQQNFNTRFDVQNYVNVTNIYGSPDVSTTAEGPTEVYKAVSLFDTATSSRGTAQSSTGVTVPQIGRAKSKGFEYVTGSASNFIFSSSSLTSAIYRHYLFDINMFTHLNITDDTAFTTGEKVTGGTSNAYGYVQSISATKSVAITNIDNTDNPGVTSTVTANGHSFKEGMQITIDNPGFLVDSSAVASGTLFTVRNPLTNTFELYDSTGTSAVNVTSYTSGGVVKHGVVVVANIVGEFSAGETITGGTSGNTASIQSDTIGFKGVRSFDFPSVKQIAMAGSPTYTADTVIDATYGESYQLFGSLSVANSGTAVTGFGTLFTTELKIGDSITFTTDAGTSITRLVEAIISDTSLVLSSAVGGSDVSTKTIATRNRGKLQGSDKNISIFRLPQQTIKTLKTTANSGQTDTSYIFRRQYVRTLSSGSVTITANVNETFASLVEGDYVVSIMDIASASTGATGDVMSLTGNNGDGNPIFTLGGSPSGIQLTLDFGTAYADAKIKVLSTVNKSIGPSKTKTLVSGSTLAVATQATIESGIINLAKADIYALNSVYMSADFSTAATTSDTDITARFQLDNGQRDNFYDVGRLKLKTGAVVPTGRLLINFDYFSHGSGDYFDVDSYSGVVDYANIPSYFSDTTGEEFDLRDCLDFRPRVDDATTINSGNIDRSFDGTGASTVDVIKFNSNITSDFEYYLPRIDKVFLDKEGNFKIAEGASGLKPQVPKALDNAMHLYTLYLNPYTLSTEDLSIKKIDNKRYTMRDIGKLEKRIENVEYYTQLSLLETQAQSLQIQDAEGFDRFKNGFIVDNFTGHGIGDVGNLDYKVSMDMAGGYMRPMFNSEAVQLIEADDDGTAIVAADRTAANYAKTGDLITLPYTEATMVDQPYASKYVNVNPFNIFTWTGSVTLDPPGDEWKETNRVPDLLINGEGSFDTMVKNLGNPNLESVEIDTVWNEWQDHWVGTPTETTTQVGNEYIGGNRVAGNGRGVGGWTVRARDVTTTSNQRVSQTRTGIRTAIVPQTLRTSLGDKVVSVAFIPFIRSRTINFTAKRLKPNTRVYAFFDNVDVTSYVTPSLGSLGGNLVSDASGEVSGTFAIPDPISDSNPRWRVGQRVFRLTSSSTNSTTDVETAAEGDYIARGTIENVQNTIVSTREATTVRQTVTDTRNINRSSTRTTQEVIQWIDPIAQTFMVDDTGGVFATSVDVYFQSKPEAGENQVPVTLQIREVVNGYPSRTVLPFSEVVLNPSSVSTSADATTATTFTFPSPVYLQEKTEYCLCLLSNCDDYNVYVARIGDTQIGSDRTISQQPYAGVFFKSQNGSTWTAEQNEDLKFKLKRAEFSNVTGTVTLVNDALPTRTLPNNPIRTTNTSGTVRIFARNHGMHGTANNVTISGLTAGTSYNGILGSEINGTYTTISNVTLDSFDIITSGTATASGDVGGTSTVITQNRLYDLANFNLGVMTVPGTNLTYAMRPTTGKSIHGSETEFSLTGASSAISFNPGDNIYFTEPYMVASDINQTNEMSGSKSLFVNLTMTTTNTKISPVLDIQRMSMVTVQNRLNSPTAVNTPNFVDDTAPSGTSSAAAYVTRPVLLENESTALDVRLTQNVRNTSEVEVYYRVSGAEEVRDINDLGWIPFNGDGSEDITVTPAESDNVFKEYKYSASSINTFTAFQVKIVLKGTNSAYPPIVRDLRGIALAV
jgi:hypothetical protein